MKSEKNARERGAGCWIALSTVLGVVVLLVAAIAFAFWRRPGPDVEIDIDVGATAPSTATVRSTYREGRDVSLGGLIMPGPARTFEIDHVVTVRGGRVQARVPSRFLSIRDEQLTHVQVEIGGGTISLAPEAPPPPEPPRLRTSGYINPDEWATRSGNVATFRSVPPFLPSTIYYDREVPRVVVELVLTPLTATRIADAPSQIEIAPGTTQSIALRIQRTVATWPEARLAFAPARAGQAEAVLVSEEDLLAVVGWASGSIYSLPLTHDEWAALRARADTRWPLAMTGRDSLTIRPPAGASGELRLVVVTFGPGETLASGAETIVVVR